MEMGHPLLKFTKSQWKREQEQDQNFQWRENNCRTNTSVKEINPKAHNCENKSPRSKQEGYSSE